MSEFTQDQVEEKVRLAIKRLYQKDSYLLEKDLNERSITHKLAGYLECEFDHWDVDCEYNRNHDDPKRLISEIGIERITTNDTEAKTVFPDIIVHDRGNKRGNERENLLVIEVKKSSSNQTRDYDIRKLQLFKKQLGYQFAIFLELGKKESDCGLESI